MIFIIKINTELDITNIKNSTHSLNSSNCSNKNIIKKINQKD